MKVPTLPDRVVVAGPMGVGKSTLVTRLATARGCVAVSADPGQPLFGPPGAVARARRRGGAWIELRVEGLATLDAARFRLPLVEAVRRLVGDETPLIVDAPGVSRGMAAAELLVSLAVAVGAEAVVWMGAEDGPLPDLLAAGLEVIRRKGSPEAVAHEPAVRRARRTEAWDRWLEGALTLAFPALPIAGAPPPAGAREGRQVVVLDGAGRTLTLGEVADGGLRAPRFPEESARALVIRDAWRDDEGRLVTAPRNKPQPRQPTLDLAAPLALPLAPGDCASVLPARLVGGLLGDPLVHLHHVNAGRDLLLDLGAHRLPAKLAHSVTHVFVSHAHFDHFGGFPWLLRHRIGTTEPLVLIGPPELAARVRSAVDGITWDRIGDTGPRFRVGEVHGETVRWFHVQAGKPGEELGVTPAPDGVVHEEPELRVRTAVLDHGIPVLAWAVEEPPRVAVRPEVLGERGWRAGPWLAELKRAVIAGEDVEIDLPDGTRQPVRELGPLLTTTRPGRKLAYATDFGDTPANRERLAALARHAHLFVCEASFLEADAARARETGHLTARVTGEIAAAAEVGLLVPFHFSHRYGDRPAAVVEEVRAAFPRVWFP